MPRWAEYDVGGSCFGVERIDPIDGEGRELLGRMVGVSLQIEDIEAVYRRLINRDIEFIAPPDKQEWGGSLAHFKDLDEDVLTLLGKQ